MSDKSYGPPACPLGNSRYAAGSGSTTEGQELPEEERARLIYDFLHTSALYNVELEVIGKLGKIRCPSCERTLIESPTPFDCSNPDHAACFARVQKIQGCA